MTIEIGVWIFPAVVTMLSFIAANNYKRPSGNSYLNFDIEGPFRLLIAIIVSLFSWFVWALFN